MKLKILTLGSAVVLFSLFVIYSCNKRDISRLAEESNVSSGLIQAAKDWYSKQIAAKNTTLSSANKKKHYLPANWKESKLITLKNGSTVLFVSSLAVKLNDQSKKGVIRKFVFQTKGNEITSGIILEMYGARDYIERREADLLEKFYDNSIDDFTGSIIYYDINYKYLGSSSFVGGKRQDTRAQVKFDRGEHRNEKNTAGIMTLDEVCTHFYLVDIYSDGTEVWTYLWTDCYDDGYNSELGGYYEVDNLTYYASPDAPYDAFYDAYIRLCLRGTGYFKSVGDSWTGGIKYLQSRWVHNSPPYESFYTNFEQSCLEIPKYIGNQDQAMAKFNKAYTDAATITKQQLDLGLILPTSTAVTAYLKAKTQEYLAAAVPGATWSTGNLCAGDIPWQEAEWCP